MRKAIVLGCAVTAMAATTPAFADTHYMLCFGGGQKALYFSAVYPVGENVKSKNEEPRFNAFVNAKYKTMIHGECHRSGTQASADSDKKIREDGFRNSKPVWNIIETNWAGK